MDNLPTKLNLDDAKVIETIRKTVAVGADDLELAMFLEFCKGAGLNPFKREAWFIKAGGRAQIMTGLNGYLKIANKHPQFDGMEIDIVEGQSGIEKAICKVYRKDRKYPSTGIALMREYKKGTPIWSQMPSVMLGKVAKCIAIREAFPLETEGTYTEEEMPEQFAAAQAPKVEVMPADDLPAKTYSYNLQGMDDETKHKAEMLLKKSKATFDEVISIWKSPVKVPKLVNYLILDVVPQDASEGAESHV